VTRSGTLCVPCWDSRDWFCADGHDYDEPDRLE
jgi:hypothetical protein